MLVDIHLDQLDLAAGLVAPPPRGAASVACTGPHQGAQKSTSTGWLRDSAITSCWKSAVVVSLIRSPPPAR
jgi:hypothetical protein